MREWAKENPRAAGLVALGGGLLLAVINTAMLFGMERYYPIIYPLACMAVPIGTYQIVTGRRPERFGEMSVVDITAMVVCVGGGAAAGLALNWLLTGEVI